MNTHLHGLWLDGVHQAGCGLTTRRNAMTALGAAAFAAATRSFAQAIRVRRIGYIGPLGGSLLGDRAVAFRSGLRELGYVEGKNLIVEWRFPAKVDQRLDDLAVDLVALKVEVIVAQSGNATGAARRATKTIPIVMVGANDPVLSGFVASLARPGGNITGISNLMGDISVKHLEMLREVLPKLSRVALLARHFSPESSTLKSVQSAARSLNVELLPVEAVSVSGIVAAFDVMVRERVQALIVETEPFIYQNSDEILALAAKHRIPTMMPTAELVEAGGLMSYGWDPLMGYKGAATYVDKILKGAKPADLPVEQPSTFELVVNTKTAKILGIKIPRTMLVRATRVIE